MAERAMSPRPIFIIGSGRSGTSALTWALGQHSNIICTPETPWLSALASWSGALYRIGSQSAGQIETFQAAPDTMLRHLGIAADGFIRETFEARFPDRKVVMPGINKATGIAWYRSVSDPKTRWVDGTPLSTSFASLLARMFPEARFVNLVREPHAVIKSWLSFSARDTALGETKSLIEHIYHSHRAGHMALAALGDRATRLMFDDMTDRPEQAIRGTLAFLGEAFEPACIEPLAAPINSSGRQVSTEEYDAPETSHLLRDMEKWFHLCRDPEWRIATPDAATAAMAEYARFQLPLPV